MSRTWNHNDFAQQFAEARRAYDEGVRREIERLRNVLNAGGSPEAVLADQSLEAQIRSYVIDPLLRALNWDLRTNLFVEAAIKGQEVRRYLDYLGVEKACGSPLLLVEAKRPNVPLPGAKRGTLTIHRQSLIQDALQNCKNDTMDKSRVDGRWQEIIGQVRDYVVGVHQATGRCPKRTIITNGEWIILFLDVEAAFINLAKAVRYDDILILESSDAVVEQARKLFESLDYFSLAPRNHALLPAELPAVIGDEGVQFGLRALEVNYSETATAHEPVPNISVAPVLLLILKNDAFLRVLGAMDERMPHRQEDLVGHLARLKAHHEQLHAEVQNHVGNAVELRAVEFLYLASSAYATLPGKWELSPNKYVVITGVETHFITSSAAFGRCRYHSGEAAAAEHKLVVGPISGPSLGRRSHFGSGDANCCLHSSVHDIKRLQVTAANRSRFGPREEREDGPFCKVWGFEGSLCCRRCVFEQVCAQSVKSAMPCRHD